jgi:hypothetical protein
LPLSLLLIDHRKQPTTARAAFELLVFREILQMRSYLLTIPSFPSCNATSASHETLCPMQPLGIGSKSLSTRVPETLPQHSPVQLLALPLDSINSIPSAAA